MQKRFKLVCFLVCTAVIPLFVSAQSVKEIFNSFTNLLALAVIPLLIAICMGVFILGIVRFIAAAGNPEQVQKAKVLIIWGLVGLLVMVAFWGIIKILLQTFFGASAPPGVSGEWPFRAFP